MSRAIPQRREARSSRSAERLRKYATRPTGLVPVDRPLCDAPQPLIAVHDVEAAAAGISASSAAQVRNRDIARKRLVHEQILSIEKARRDHLRSLRLAGGIVPSVESLSADPGRALI